VKSAATHGLGWAMKQVTVQEFNPARLVARCVDTEGLYLDVATSVRRCGIQPMIGQVWLVDRDMGAWTFRAYLDLAVSASRPDWTSLALQAGWTASTGTDDAEPEARTTDSGWIELSGVMTGGTMPAVGSALTVGHLPAEFPARKRGSAVLAAQIPSGASGHVCGSLLPSGAVTIQVTAAYTPSWIDLTGLRARIA
jgi:hypothetical protein